jgi:dihydroorotate dehydrogenase (fumarate)
MDASNLDNLLEMLLDYDTYISSQKQTISTSEYVEINLSCPSTTCPRIIAYDILTLARVLESIKLLELHTIQIGLKLAPYVDKILLQNVANLIVRYQSSARIGYIVCANSIPNGMVVNPDTGVPVLSAKTGGISSVANKLLGVANVYQFNELLQKQGKRQSIRIIGCGGIETLRDIQEYLAASADSVQIGRFLYTQGVNCLAPLIAKL